MRHRCAGGCGDCLRNAEVENQWLALEQHDVLWLDVAVNYSTAVGKVERSGCSRDYSHRFVERNLSLAIHSLAERFAFYVRHDVIDDAVMLTRVVQRHNVRMTQSCGRGDLRKEARGAHRRRDLRIHHFYCNAAVVPEIARAIDRRHAAAADFALNVVRWSNIR